MWWVVKLRLVLLLGVAYYVSHGRRELVPLLSQYRDLVDQGMGSDDKFPGCTDVDVGCSFAPDHSFFNLVERALW